MLQTLWGIIELVLYPLLIVIFAIFLPQAIFFIRYKLRNNAIKNLVKEFNLRFEDKLPPWKQISSTFYRDVALNYVSGNIGRHLIYTRDVCNNSWSRMMTQGWRETMVYVDDRKIIGSWKNVTLGSELYFASVPELRKYFNTLKQD